MTKKTQTPDLTITRNRYLDTFKEVLVDQVKTERYQENLSKFIEYHSRELL